MRETCASAFNQAYVKVYRTSPNAVVYIGRIAVILCELLHISDKKACELKYTKSIRCKLVQNINPIYIIVIVEAVCRSFQQSSERAILRIFECRQGCNGQGL